MPPLIALSKIEHRQGAFRLAIDRLELQAGQIYALCGPNGAGKSTLLRLLALLEEPQQGEVHFCGVAVTGAGSAVELRRQVTMVHQSPYLLAGSVGDNLAFGLRLRGIGAKERQQRIAEALAAVGLQGFEQRPVGELSGGEAQRVALARALALRPKLLLLDEPTAGLDREQQPAFERWLASLPQTGMTLVIATHDPHQPRRLGAEVIRLRSGRLDPPSQPTDGPPQNLKEYAPWLSPLQKQEA